MKPSTKLFLRVFLMTGLVYAVLMTVLDLIDGNFISLWEFLAFGILFGFAMAATMVPLQMRALKKLDAAPITDEKIKLYQSREVESSLKRTEILERLKADPLTSKMKITEKEEEIRLRTSPSPASFGEKIRILFTDQPGEKQKLTLISRPLIFLNVIDNGKNWQNVEYLDRLLTDTGA